MLVGIFDLCGDLNPNPYLITRVRQLLGRALPDVDIVEVDDLEDEKCKGLKFLLLLPSVYNNRFSLDKLTKFRGTTTVPVALWTFEDPYEFDLNMAAFELVDHLFCNDEFVSNCYINRDKISFCPIGADETQWLVRPSNRLIEKKKFQLTFVGAGYYDRIQILKRIADNFPANSLLNFQLVHAEDKCPQEWLMKQRLSPESLREIYVRSFAAVYLPRRLNFANLNELSSHTPAPRIFEATLAGSVPVVSEDDLGVFDYLTPGVECLTYATIRELAEKTSQLTLDRDFYMEIISNAQQKILDNYLMSFSTQKVANYIRKALEQ